MNLFLRKFAVTISLISLFSTLCFGMGEPPIDTNSPDSPVQISKDEPNATEEIWLRPTPLSGGKVLDQLEFSLAAYRPLEQKEPILLYAILTIKSHWPPDIENNQPLTVITNHGTLNLKASPTLVHTGLLNQNRKTRNLEFKSIGYPLNREQFQKLANANRISVSFKSGFTTVTGEFPQEKTVLIRRFINQFIAPYHVIDEAVLTGIRTTRTSGESTDTYHIHEPVVFHYDIENNTFNSLVFDVEGPKVEFHVYKDGRFLGNSIRGLYYPNNTEQERIMPFEKHTVSVQWQNPTLEINFRPVLLPGNYEVIAIPRLTMGPYPLPEQHKKFQVR